MWSIVLQCGAYNQWIAYWRIRLVNYIHTSWRYYVQLWQCGRVVVWCIKWFDYVHTIRSVDYIHTSSYYYAQPSQYDQSCCSVVHSICGFHNGKKNRKHTKHQKKKAPRDIATRNRANVINRRGLIWRDTSMHYEDLFTHICDMTRSYMWHYSFIYVTWLIHMCGMTHSYTWHDSFIFVTLLTHVRVCECASICDMTHSYMWHESFI